MPGVLMSRRGPISATGTPPTFVSYTATTFDASATTKTTASISVNSGDLLVVALVTQEMAVVAAPSGGSLTYTAQQSSTTANYCALYLYTATATSTTSFTVSATGPAGEWGFAVYVFRNATIGASSKTAVTTGAPTLNLTTTKSASAVVVISGDWGANDGATRAWRTGAGPFTEKAYYFNGATYTTYGGYHANAGPIGTYAVGATAPAGQTYSIMALEIKGP